LTVVDAGPLSAPDGPKVPAKSVMTLCTQLAEVLLREKLKLATAESCTGGLIAAACTELSGSSAWFERGFVSYSNDAKSEMLGVDGGLIERHGAVSEEVARAMAYGAVAHSCAQIAVAVTGVAGPSGGSKDKPVGTVWFGWNILGQLYSELRHFDGDRAAVRAATVRHGLQRLLEHLGQAT
jgi:nicotinamide-nucleotide amidase